MCWVKNNDVPSFGRIGCLRCTTNKYVAILFSRKAIYLFIGLHHMQLPLFGLHFLQLIRWNGKSATGGLHQPSQCVNQESRKALSFDNELHTSKLYIFLYDNFT